MINSNATTATTLKTSLVNNKEFTLTPTYAEMDQYVLMDLADNMLRELGGSRLVNSEIEFILKHATKDYENAPFCEEDITNNLPTGLFTDLEGVEVELSEEGKDYLIGDIQDAINDLAGDIESHDKCQELEQLLGDTEDQYCEDYPEIMQWFALDERLIRRFEEAGECTLCGEYWGRQAFGQSITMDHIMMKTCYDLAMCWSK